MSTENERANDTGSGGGAGPQQLELLPAPGVPVRYQLSRRTRRIGMAGVARARALLAEQAARRHDEADEVTPLAPPHAA